MTEFQIRRCARSLEISGGTDSRDAVLGIHGYGGYPGELALPAKLLARSGFDVYVPRLPGHGTCQQDFDRTGAEQWYQEVVRTYQRISADHETVHLMGHSMGGLLALLLASGVPIGRIVLFAPALRLISPAARYTGILKHFRHAIPIPWEADPQIMFFDTRDPEDDEFLGREYWSSLNLKNIHELVRLQRRTKKVLKDITSEILVITGGKDAAVHISSAEMICERVPSRVEHLHLEDASHLIPYDPDERSRRKAMDAMLGWFSSDQ